MIEIRDISSTVILSAPESKNNTRKAILMNTDECSLSFELADKVTLPAMAYIEHNGVKYYLEDVYNPESDGDHYHKYTPKFVAYWCLTKNKLFKRYTPSGQGEVDFAYDGYLSKFGELIVASLNNVLPLNNWTLGECPQGGMMEYFTFDSINVFPALNEISGRFKVEWWFDGSVLNFGKCENGTLITLSTEMVDTNGVIISGGLKNVSKDQTKDVQPQYLYAYGGTKNIVRETDTDGQSYYNRLQLPDGIPYIEIEGATSGADTSVKYDDIYPRIEGTIEEVTSSGTGADIIYYVKDNERGFVLKDVTIDGMIPRIIFTSGRLTSREFNIQDTASTVTQTNGVMEIFREEQEGVTLPNENARPQVGDKYTIYNILLPKEKETEARQELLAKAIVDAELLAGFSPQLTCVSNEIDFINKNINLTIGQRLKLNDKQLKGGYTETRVIELEYKFDSDKSVSFKTASSLAVGNIVNIQNKLNELGSNLRLISDGEQYHPLRGRSYLPLSASELQAKELKSFDYSGAGFDKAGFAVLPHPDFPNETLAVFDHLNIRKTFNVYEIIANQAKYQGGKMIFSATAMTITKVEDGDSYWRLFFDNKEGQVKNLWDIGDMALCQEFDAQNNQIRYYRLKVTTANLNDNYIHVSKGGGDTPKVDDFIIQHGHETNKQRQNILTIDTIGGARFASIQGLTEDNASGKMVAEMGWVDGKPQFFVGDINSSYIKYDGAAELLDILANVLFRSPTGENVPLQGVVEDTLKKATDASVITNNYTSIQGGLILTTKEELGVEIDGKFYPKLILDGSVSAPKDALLTIGDDPLTQTKYLLDGTVSMFGGKLGIDNKGNTFGNFATIYIGGINAIDFFNNFDTYFDATDKEWLKIKKKTHVSGVISSDQGVVMFGTQGGSGGGGGGMDILELQRYLTTNPEDWKLATSYLPSGIVYDGDARLTNARPASDVYAWAKAASKPSYDVGELTSFSSTPSGDYGVRYTSNGYILANIFHDTFEQENSIPVNSIYVRGADTYLRNTSPDNFRNKLGLWSTANLTRPITTDDRRELTNISEVGNKIWLDYNFAGLGIAGSVLSFSGIGGGYNVDLMGTYGQSRLLFRTRNGDNGTYNPVYEIFHTGNANSQNLDWACRDIGIKNNIYIGINRINPHAGGKWIMVNGRPEGTRAGIELHGEGSENQFTILQQYTGMTYLSNEKYVNGVLSSAGGALMLMGSGVYFPNKTDNNIGIGIEPTPDKKLIVRGTVGIGQYSNGISVIDAYNGYAFYGCNEPNIGIKIDRFGNTSVTGTVVMFSTN